MSNGLESGPRNETKAPAATDVNPGWGRELVRALDERYLGQFVIEALATLDKTAVKTLKKFTGRSTSAG